MNTQHLEEMGCKFGEALARLKARHMMRSLPLQGAAAASVHAASDSLPPMSTFVDDDFATYVPPVTVSAFSLAVTFAVVIRCG